MICYCYFQALIGSTVDVPTLGGRPVQLKTGDSVVHPGMVRRIQGEGLPHPKQPSKRGDIVVEFDIQFPDRLSQSVRNKLADLLPVQRTWQPQWPSFLPLYFILAIVFIMRMYFSRFNSWWYIAFVARASTLVNWSHADELTAEWKVALAHRMFCFITS